MNYYHSSKLAPFRDIGLFFLNINIMIKFNQKIMATTICERILIESEKDNYEPVVMFLNAENQIFVSNEQDDATNFWFTFTKDDWEEIKSFIDKQFNLLKQ